MGIFGKSAQEKSVDELISSYGGNAKVEDYEKKLVQDLSIIYNKKDLLLATRDLQVKEKIDQFSDNLIACLLSDEVVIKAIKLNTSNDKNIIRSIIDAFKFKKK